jgi:hypothetical protein
MKDYQSSMILDNEMPDLVEEVSDDLIYTATLETGDTAKAKICKIEKSGNITTRKYPNGSVNHKFDWDERANYTYQFKK